MANATIRPRGAAGIGNIAENPQFVDTTQNDFHLTEDSPCIDAGDPTSPLDPDSTRADMGVLYFDQTNPTPVSVTLTPASLPIIIPASGGSFQYDVTVANLLFEPVSFDAWIIIQLPDSSWFGPILGPLQLQLIAYQLLSRNRTQNVPGYAPEGLYNFVACVGEYPDDIWDSDSFPFTKVGVGDCELGSGDWCSTGEEFTSIGVPSTSGRIPSPPTKMNVTISPNPFNPSTVISYQFSANSHVSLRIYDIAGRLVATLVNGWRVAGQHQVTFDGSGLPSGVYVVKVEVGEFAQSYKALLLK